MRYCGVRFVRSLCHGTRSATIRQTDDSEEKEFLRQLIAEKKEEQARRKEVEEKRRFDEMIRQEIERNSEAMEARVMSKIGRHYLAAKDEARWEETRCHIDRTPRPSQRQRVADDFTDKDIEEIENEIAKLYELREKKRKVKHSCTTPVRRSFRQPDFNCQGSVDNERPGGESSRMGELRGRSKVAAGSGPDGILTYILAQRRLLTPKTKDQLKAICAQEGVTYTTKASTIKRIVEVLIKNFSPTLNHRRRVLPTKKSRRGGRIRRKGLEERLQHRLANVLKNVKKGKAKVQEPEDSDELYASNDSDRGEVEALSNKTGNLTIKEKRKRSGEKETGDSPPMETPKKRHGKQGRKIPATIGPIGRLKYVTENLRDLADLTVDELKQICKTEDVQWEGKKMQTILAIANKRTQVAYRSHDEDDAENVADDTSTNEVAETGGDVEEEV
ncbi:hypothetical protein CBR_g19599 [Chara braunii]|uniref:Uncharacterized protein n=1 Tax=Chara braunii TaxID=69332 RepID=A0A388KYF0_CHABU|nr:hypothetical protein CBR_g19599 [Chara braunii]|eukprot:GBG75086.1 hypothetical protein CBR_g19599 [Chara braunii]